MPDKESQATLAGLGMLSSLTRLQLAGLPGNCRRGCLGPDPQGFIATGVFQQDSTSPLKTCHIAYTQLGRVPTTTAFAEQLQHGLFTADSTS